jgi:hypothetical protein
MRSLLVQHAQADSIAAPARARRHRMLAATAGFAAVAAVTAGVVTIAVAGVPLFSGSPASTGATSPSPTRSAAPAPSPTPTPSLAPVPPTEPTPASPSVDTTPPSVDQFIAAVTTAGFECSTWQPVEDQLPGRSESGWCLPSQLSFSRFDTEADVIESLQRNEDSLETQRVLYGPRWIVGTDDVTGQSDDLIALQAVFGGSLSWDPSAPPAP